jgi:8-oxo-dGTP diphosphatase
VIFQAKNGAEIIEKINVEEDEAIRILPTLNHALVVVKIDTDYLLGWHKWRSDWEIFGGLVEKGESLRECIVRECEEELGLKDLKFEYLGVIHYYMPPNYWVDSWHEEYGGLYGITLPTNRLSVIEKNRRDRDEIGEIALLSDLKKREEPIDEINEKLLEFYDEPKIGSIYKKRMENR